MRFGLCLWCVVVSGRAEAQDLWAVQDDLCPPYEGLLFDAAELLPSLGGSSTLSLAAGDIDADGLDEVVAAMGGTSPGIVVHHRSVVDGTWTSDLTSHAGFVNDIELGDVDGDGDLDVLGWGCGYYGPYLFDNVVGTIAAPIDLQLWTGCDDHAALDFDGDGDLDLVATFWAPIGLGYGYQSAEFGEIYENVGGGLFYDLGSLSVRFGGMSLTDGDVDGDGDEDLVLHGHDWESDAGGYGPGYAEAEVLQVYAYSLAAPAQFLSLSSDERTLPNDDELLLADLDGDGIQDLVVTSCEEDSVRWLVGLGGSFGDEADVTTSIDCPELPTAADVDLDDDLDLVVGGPSGGFWIENAGNGVWEAPIPVVADRDVVALTTSDLNMDGDLSPDLAFGFDTSDVVEVYFNQTPVCIVPCQCGVGPGASAPWLLLVAGAFLVHRRSASSAARARSTS